MKYLEFTPRQKEIFDNLMAICESNEAFYFQDFPADEEEGTVYRIFNYRQASYTDWLVPDALECRGICFEVSDYGNPVRLVARPMAKFFNLNENPLAMVKDIFDDEPLVHVKESLDKADGSLIKSYVDHTGLLGLQTKGSPNSDQARAATAWITHRESFYDQTLELSQMGWTVNMEWCAPDNRIVLAYAEPHLQVLNVRNNDTGEYMSRRDIGICAPAVKEHMVKLSPLPKASTIDECVELVRAQTGIEGYVVTFDNGLQTKWKTDWYKTRHHCKDSVTVPRRLFEVCVQSSTDDLKDMFATDPVAIKLIEDMEDFVRPIYNSICDRVETFYQENKDLSQKDYAVKGQQILDKKMGEFGLAMSLYNGKEVDYVSNLKKKWKILGLKDERTNIH